MKGSHGSISKAGKIRDSTPKIPKSNLSKKRTPRNRHRRNHRVRVVIPYLIAIGAIKANPKLKGNKQSTRI